MAAYTAGKSGKVSGAIWKLNGTGPEEKLPGAGQDLTVPEGVTAKWNKDEKPRSVICAGSVVEEAASCTIGAATAAPSNVALEVASTGTFTVTTNLESSASEAQIIKLAAGKTIAKTVTLKTGKWKFGTKFTQGAEAVEKFVVLGGELQANGQTYEGAMLSCETAGAIDRTGLVVVALGSLGVGWSCRPGAGALVGTVNDLYEIGNGAHPSAGFLGGGQEYGTVKLIGRACRVESSQTIKNALEVLNKGVGEEGIKTKVGQTTTVLSGASLVFNGTEAEPNRIESSKAEESHKWVIPAAGIETTARIVIIDQDFSGGGKLYAPNAVTITRSPNVVKEAKPTESGKLAGSVSSAAVATAVAQAPGGARGVANPAAVANAAAQAAGTPIGKLKEASGLVSAFQARGAPAGRTTGAVSLVAKVQASGRALGRVSSSVGSSGRAEAAGRPHGTVTAASGTVGRFAGARGTLRAALAAVFRLVGVASSAPVVVGPPVTRVTISQDSRVVVASQVSRVTVETDSRVVVTNA